MKAAGALACAGLSVAVTACGAQQSVNEAQLWVECSVGCLVTVDGQPAARAQGPLLVEVAVGVRQLAVSAPGYLTQRFDLEVRSGRSVVLSVDLWPALPGIDAPWASPDRVQQLLVGERP